jgi:hypothetical protein
MVKKKKKKCNGHGTKKREGIVVEENDITNIKI